MYVPHCTAHTGKGEREAVIPEQHTAGELGSTVLPTLWGRTPFRFVRLFLNLIHHGMWSYFVGLIHVQLALQIEQPEQVYTLFSWFCFFTYLVVDLLTL